MPAVVLADLVETLKTADGMQIGLYRTGTHHGARWALAWGSGYAALWLGDHRTEPNNEADGMSWFDGASDARACFDSLVNSWRSKGGLNPITQTKLGHVSIGWRDTDRLDWTGDVISETWVDGFGWCEYSNRLCAIMIDDQWACY